MRATYGSSPTFANDGFRSAGARRLLAFALLVAIAAIEPTRAEDTGEHAVVRVAQAADPEADDARTPRTSSAEPPPGVAVTTVRGRELDAIETEVPESITQFDASAIEALGAQSVSDLAMVTPNLEIRQGEATQSTFFIRGVGLADFNSNASGAVALYYDDVSVSAPPIQNQMLFDIQDVEVFRGPQATGLARNASGGAIKIQSRLPTGNYSAEVRTRTGRYDADSEQTSAGLIQDYSGALEVPIVSGALSSRFAFRFRDAEPYMTNGCGDAPPFGQRVVRTAFPNNAEQASICGERSLTGNLPFNSVSQIPVGLDREVGDQYRWAARGTFRLQPPESEMDWILNAHGSRLDQQSTLGQAIGTGQGEQGPAFGGGTGAGSGNLYREPDQAEESAAICQRDPSTGRCVIQPERGVDTILGRRLAESRPLDRRPFRGDYNRVGQTTLDSWGGYLKGIIGFERMTFTTVTGYDAYERTRDADTDFTPEVLFEADSQDEAWQVTQDVKLEGELETVPVRWEVGGFYLREQLEFHERTILALRDIERDYEQQLDSFAVFAKASWDFLDAFTLEGGVRYNWERKEFDFAQRSFLPSQSKLDETWQEPTGTISLQYLFTEGVSAYWKYSRGFKPGHYNASLGRGTDRPPARQELIDAFETGLRGSWFDRRLALGSAFFFYMYEDYQVFIFAENPGAPPTREIVNADEVEVAGVEVDATLKPLAGWTPRIVDGLRFTGRFGWLESRFLEFQNEVFQQSEGKTFPLVIDFSGNSLINSPRFKLSGEIEWPLDFGSFGTIIPRYDFSWSDDVFFDPTEGIGRVGPDGTQRLPDFAAGQPAFWLHNARLTYRLPTKNIEVSLWVRNLEDETYKTFAFDASQFQNLVINFVGEPRTIGFDLSVTF